MNAATMGWFPCKYAHTTPNLQTTNTPESAVKRIRFLSLPIFFSISFGENLSDSEVDFSRRLSGKWWAGKRLGGNQLPLHLIYFTS